MYTGTMPKLLMRPRLPRPNDPDIIERFTNAIKRGHGITSAATLAGIHRATAHEWIQQGTADIEARVPSSHATFVDAFQSAEAECIDARLGVIEDVTLGGGDKAWLPAMTLLERRWPKVYGRQQYVDVQSTSLSITVTLPPGAVPALARTLGNAGLLAPVDADAEVTEPGS